MKEEVLSGGTLSRVVRLGDKVLRPSRSWTPTIHRLLRHLESVGFPAPRVLGVDNQGREMLTFIEGRPGTKPWLDELRTPEGLRSFTRLVRDYHDAVAGFDPGEDAEWCIGRASLKPGEIVCHGDLGADNSIWRDGQPIALIDWDLAQPGTPLRDLAQFCYYVVPLREERVWRSVGFEQGPDWARRLEVICESYGGYEPADIVSEVREYLLEVRERTASWGAAGREPWATYFERDGLQKIERDLSWLAEHESALLGPTGQVVVHVGADGDSGAAGPMPRIVLVPHNPDWHDDFERETLVVAPAFGDLLVSLHHIGSTAIPDIEAKPVIDMLAVVTDIGRVDAQSPEFEELGYEAMGEFGIPGRRYFRKDSASGERTHQIHAFRADSPEVDRHLAFRDFMRAHPQFARQYAALKRELAEQYPNDMNEYTGGKSEFIKDMDARATAWQREDT